MRRTVFIFVGLAAVAVLGFAFLGFGPSEPSYKGRPLSEWWDELGQSGSDDTSPAEWEARSAMFTNVVRSIGTDALPFYVSCLSYKKPSKWYDRLDDWLRYRSSNRFGLPQTSDRRAEACVCIRILGPAAEPVIPALEQLLFEEYNCGPAASCLAAIGPAAFPVLSNAVATAPNSRVRFTALQALGDMGPVAQAASPMLLELVRTQDSSVGVSVADLALRALVEVETNAAVLTPLLVDCLTETNTAPGAAYGLARLGAPGVPVLLTAVTNENGKIRAAASAALEMDFQKYAANRSVQFSRFNALFNSRLLSTTWSSYSGHENQRIELVLFRYATNENEQVRSAATNALEHFQKDIF